MERQLVNAIMENRSPGITSAVREHLQVSTDELTEMLEEGGRLG
jgi:hypothetical protein